MMACSGLRGSWPTTLSHLARLSFHAPNLAAQGRQCPAPLSPLISRERPLNNGKLDYLPQPFPPSTHNPGTDVHHKRHTNSDK